MMHGAGLGMPRSTAPGDTILAPGSSGVMSPGVARLLLSGSLGFPPPPIDWRQVEDDVEFACLQVASQ
jgi:hypothetical protein